MKSALLQIKEAAGVCGLFEDIDYKVTVLGQDEYLIECNSGITSGIIWRSIRDRGIYMAATTLTLLTEEPLLKLENTIKVKGDNRGIAS